MLVPVHGAPDGTAVVQVALSPEQLHDGVLASWLVLAGIGTGLVLLGLVLADRLGARLVGATRSLAGTADRLAGGDLTARAEPAGPPELRLIGDQLNRLAARIDELLAAERENAADLAHRLRTPVAALRLDAETLRDPAEAERITTGVAALEHGVDEVIRRARRPLREAEPACDLSAVARGRTAFWTPLAEDQDRAVEVDTPPGSLRVPVPPDELAAALDALIGNVFDRTPPRARASVSRSGRRVTSPSSWWRTRVLAFPTAESAPTRPPVAPAVRAPPAWAWTSRAVRRRSRAARSRRRAHRGRR
ncbi:HAMP domain-containing sensor histidine kinase [Streptomyces sp. NL15-2K]|uniref:sensor histidine kinase n=1 Tax=Streptomyces sp. NL15-2K TaxID=376149 RepID=UPI000FF9ECD2|nr:MULTISPECIES: HAMP domain-containing sensor histidine kinase [Actinomycetes]WKX15806.1 HAMP domain-containing sensor histidine kinase [Kutzneria buriramensis]GCB42855.1 two-component system sensor kinase [Streptomyces sp. NL15-2K]